jgi:hypothetical protein
MVFRVITPQKVGSLRTHTITSNAVTMYALLSETMNKWKGLDISHDVIDN